jgi:hypothetical protein
MFQCSRMVSKVFAVVYLRIPSFWNMMLCQWAVPEEWRLQIIVLQTYIKSAVDSITYFLYAFYWYTMQHWGIFPLGQIRRVGFEVKHLPSFNAEIRMGGTVLLLYLYAFIACIHTTLPLLVCTSPIFGVPWGMLQRTVFINKTRMLQWTRATTNAGEYYWPT